MSFLRFQKNCPVALFERTPRHGFGQPDVLGITKARFLLEIEIKRTFSDFRANDKKPHIACRNHLTSGDDLVLSGEYGSRWPKQFWYLVPPELVRKVEPIIPDYAGLMRGPGRNEFQQVIVEKHAPTNPMASRLTPKEMMRLGNCMANQIWSQARRIEALRNDGVSNEHESSIFEWWYPRI